MWYAQAESGVFSRQSLPSRSSGGHGRWLSASQIPEKSGFPFVVFGAGAATLTDPLRSRGTLGVGWSNHWADTLVVTTETAATTMTMDSALASTGTSSH